MNRKVQCFTFLNPNLTIMTKQPLYKKISAFGFVLLLVSFPLLIIIEIKTVDFLEHLQVLNSDQGIVCALFSIGILFFCIGLILRKFNKA